MNSSAAPSPAPTPIEALASMLVWLWHALWSPDSPAAQLRQMFQNRLTVIGDRISAIAARVEAGTQRGPRLRARRLNAPPPNPPDRPVKRAPNNPFPCEYGWLVKYLGQDVATEGGTLLALIRTPEMQALMAAAPHVGDLLREMFHACGSLDEARPFLPPTRSERARRRLATAAPEPGAEPESSATPSRPRREPAARRPASKPRLVRRNEGSRRRARSRSRSEFQNTAPAVAQKHGHFVTIS